ncbi:MAG: hypothetical protein ACFNW0_02350 [Fretibacterium sp.]|nr:hypothetical protein [uncultured Fretibacterium sp.]
MVCGRSSLCLTLFLTFMLLCPSSTASAGPLPDAVGPWLAESGDAIPFRTASEDLGVWHNRIYTRSAPPGRIEAILMEGPGPGTLLVPQGAVSADDLPLGFGARYQTLDIAGRRAVLERQDILGTALAIELGKNKTLTLESAGASQEELTEFAEGIFALSGITD